MGSTLQIGNEQAGLEGMQLKMYNVFCVTRKAYRNTEETGRYLVSTSELALNEYILYCDERVWPLFTHLEQSVLEGVSQHDHAFEEPSKVISRCFGFLHFCLYDIFCTCCGVTFFLLLFLLQQVSYVFINSCKCVFVSPSMPAATTGKNSCSLWKPCIASPRWLGAMWQLRSIFPASEPLVI